MIGATLLPPLLLGVALASVDAPVSTHDGAFHVEMVDNLRRGVPIQGWYPIGFHASVAAVLRLTPWVDTARGTADAAQALAMLAPLAIFSLARSRYDHYALLVYPALAIAVGALLVEKLPVRPWLRALAALACLGAAGALHVPRDLATFHGDEELRALAQLASSRLQSPARILAYNTHAYSLRYYATLDVTTLLESEKDLADAEELNRAGMPCPVELATDLAANLRARPLPFALVLPRARLDLVAGVKLTAIGETPHYLLFEGD